MAVRKQKKECVLNQNTRKNMCSITSIKYSSKRIYKSVDTLIIDVRFIVLFGITFVAMVLFVVEGLLLYRKLNPKRVDEK